MNVQRLIIAIDPDPGVRDRVREASASMRSLAPRVRWVNPEQLHVTLVFLGDVTHVWAT